MSACRRTVVRVRVDGETYDVTEVPELSKSKMHNIEVIVDRLVGLKEGIRSRLFDWGSRQRYV